MCIDYCIRMKTSKASKASVNFDKIEERKKRVLEAKMKDPTKSHEEIAKEVEIPRRTVTTYIAALARDGRIPEEGIINAIKDADLEIVTLSQNILIDRFNSSGELEKISARDVSAISRDSHLRRAFLSGENATKKGGQKEIKVINYADSVQLPSPGVSTSAT